MAYERKERKRKREIRRPRDGMLARRKKEEKFIAYRGRIPRSGEKVYGRNERIKKKERRKKSESYEVVKRSNRLKYRESKAQ